MRKIIVSMNVTLDSFMAGPSCELDWHFKSWSPEMAECLCEQLARADTILLGRITYMAFARYWPSRSIDLSFPREDMVFVEMMNSYSKVVFSKTLDYAVWNNSKLIKGNLAKEVCKLKQQPGKAIMIYGSGKLVAALMKLGLVDEYQLWVHPTAIGKGKALFRNLKVGLNLELVNTRTFKSGVVMLFYKQL